MVLMLLLNHKQLLSEVFAVPPALSCDEPRLELHIVATGSYQYLLGSQEVRSCLR